MVVGRTPRSHLWTWLWVSLLQWAQRPLEARAKLPTWAVAGLAGPHSGRTGLPEMPLIWCHCPTMLPSHRTLGRMQAQSPLLGSGVPSSPGSASNAQDTLYVGPSWQEHRVTARSPAWPLGDASLHMH